jgi:hypothetical protein
MSESGPDGHPELGIYADEKGDLTDTWIDGTRGTTEWCDDGCMPQCVTCMEEVIHDDA